MKLTIVISAAITLVLFILGSTFKVLHWYGADRMLLSASVIAILVFIPSTAIVIYRDWTKEPA